MKLLLLGLPALGFVAWVGGFAPAMFNESPKECADQNAKMCCQMTKETSEATVAFASLADDGAFVRKHENPLPFEYVGKEGEKITFKATDGTDASGFAFKTKKATKKYLLVFQEWWGLNDHIKAQSAQFFKDLKGVNVVAIDLYDGKLATTREEAAKLMQGANPERIKAIIQGYLNTLPADAQVATVGWCFGGGWSLQASLLAEGRAKACIIYYGMPEKDKTRLAKLNAEVLGIFAGQEKWISPEIAQEFEANLKELGKKNTVKIFDADHAFANPSNPKYNKEMAAEAYQMSLTLLKRTL